MTASDNVINIGFIGAGHHATWTLYPCLQYFPQINLSCVCDIDVEKANSAARRFGAERSYTDIRLMWDREKLDAVFCCGGPVLHAQVIADAIARHIPLFVEKPPAPIAAELKELSQLADNANAIVMVAFMHRFAPVTAWARKILASEKFGKTMMIYAREGLWGMNREGLVMDSGIHHIDLMRSLCGEVAWVQATGCSDGDKRHAVVATLQFKNGILGQLNLNSLESLSTPSDIMEIHGDKGQWLRLDNWTKAACIRDPGVLFSPPDDPTESSLVYEHGWTAAGTNRSTLVQGYVGEIVHFLECLASGCKPEPNLWDGYRDMQLVEAIELSAKTSKRIDID